jgi:hypothetical protein
MKTKVYLRILFIALLYALMFSACGKHPDPATGQEVKADLKDFLASAFGWSSYEELEMTGGEGPMLISITDEDAANQVLLAFPDTFVIGAVGDRWVNTLSQSGAGSVIGEGEAYAARMQSSLYAIQKAFEGNPAARLFLDPTERYVATFFPSAGNAWHMGFVDITNRSMFTMCKQLMNCGSFINYQSASEMTKAMQDNGWKVITASQIPQGVRSYFMYRMSWLSKAWFMRLNGVISSPVFMPGGAFLVPQQILLPGYNLEEQPQQ